jgi:hypothetical protein
VKLGLAAILGMKIGLLSAVGAFVVEDLDQVPLALDALNPRNVRGVTALACVGA